MKKLFILTFVATLFTTLLGCTKETATSDDSTNTEKVYKITHLLMKSLRPFVMNSMQLVKKKAL